MGYCTFCGKDAGAGGTFHIECKEGARRAERVDTPAALSDESRMVALAPISEAHLGQTIQGAVYRAILFAFLTVAGLVLAISILVRIATVVHL